MLTCKKCNNKLNWEDTHDAEGGVLEGYLIERQIWTCPHCQTDYCVSARINFCEKDIIFEDLVENE